jgi:diketogulonate reductase-like aldo/keto reductase
MMLPTSPVGLGTYGIGGRGHRDVALTEQADDRTYLDATVHALDAGIDFTEVSMGYGHGNAARLLAQAADRSQRGRDGLFVTHALYPRDLAGWDTIQDDTNSFYQLFDGRADSTLVTQSLLLTFDPSDVYAWLHEELDAGRTRYVSLSNAGAAWVERFATEFGDRFFAHETHIGFNSREVIDAGVVDATDRHHVRTHVWRPLGRGRIEADPPVVLTELAQRYDTTPGGVTLAWLVQHGWHPMVFSTNTDHIDANLKAATLELDNVDRETIDRYRATGSDDALDWDDVALDDQLVALASR